MQIRKGQEAKWLKRLKKRIKVPGLSAGAYWGVGAGMFFIQCFPLAFVAGLLIGLGSGLMATPVASRVRT